jgi:hypothetical protein
MDSKDADDNKDEDEKCIEHTERWLKLNERNKIISKGGSTKNKKKIKKIMRTRMRKSKENKKSKKNKK